MTKKKEEWPFKSKTLTLENRKSIRFAISLYVQEKWDDSALKVEMDEIANKLSEAVYKRQCELIPEEDRAVLFKYGMEEIDHNVPIRYDKNEDKFTASFYGSPYITTRIITNIYKYPDDYPRTETYIVKFWSETCPDLLKKYWSVYEVYRCEIDKAINAYNKILDNCNTTYQVWKNEYLRPFFPNHLRISKEASKVKKPLTVEEEVLLRELGEN